MDIAFFLFCGAAVLFALAADTPARAYPPCELCGRTDHESLDCVW